MSDFDKLVPTNEIPFEEAASFFVVLKEASIEGEIDRAEAFDKLAASIGNPPKADELLKKIKRDVERKPHAKLTLSFSKGKIKKATTLTPEEVEDRVRRGLKSGISSTVSGDVRHAASAGRTRKERFGKEIGTGAGVLAGLMATRGRSPGMKAVGAGIGALLGRGAGKQVGREMDVSKIRKRLKSTEKRGEMEKYTGTEKAAGLVRELWKIAQGQEMTDPVAGQAGAAASPEPVEFMGFSEEPAAQGRAQQAAPRTQQSQGLTPEEREYQAAMEQLALEQLADQQAEMSEAEHYRQVAEESGAAAEQLGAQLQQAQAAAEQLSQQAQMAQMQADQATQQATQQAQMDAAEKQQLSQQAIGQQNLNMNMRQAMQNYREQLQQIALQDPAAEAEAAAAPTMPQPSPGEIQSMMANQQMGKEQMQAAEAAEQGVPPEAADAPTGMAPPPGPQVVPEMLAAEQPAPKKKPEKSKKEGEGKGGVTVNVEKTSSLKTRLKTMNIAYGLGTVRGGLDKLRKMMGKSKDTRKTGLDLPEAVAYHLGRHRRKYQAGAGAIAATEAGRRILKAKKEREKTSSFWAVMKRNPKRHELETAFKSYEAKTGKGRNTMTNADILKHLPPKTKTAALSDRATGAVVGALGGAGLQALSDQSKGGSPSAKERWLRMKVEEMENRPKKGAFDKHMINMTKAMAEAAKINREHPGAAALTAGATGALVGATAGPTALRAVRRLGR